MHYVAEVARKTSRAPGVDLRGTCSIFEMVDKVMKDSSDTCESVRDRWPYQRPYDALAEYYAGKRAIHGIADND